MNHMRYIVSIFFAFLILLVYPKSSHAIIFLPALILIPIAKIIGIILAGFALPVTGIGILWGKLSQKSLIKTVGTTVVLLLLLSLALGLLLKLHDPNRPIF